MVLCIRSFGEADLFSIRGDVSKIQRNRGETERDVHVPPLQKAM